MNKYIKCLREQDTNSNTAWIIENAQYIAITGSQSYGIETEESDYDLIGFTIPPEHITFPFHNGYIYNFSKDIPNFEQRIYSKSHLANGKEVEGVIYNILKYFRLCMDNNPNMLDSLFVRENLVLKNTKIGEMVRTKRQNFLHKGLFYKFKGYAFSQMKKCESQTRMGKRKEDVEKYGYDRKFAGHIFRLLNECEQLLRFHDMDLMEGREEVRHIREGNWTLEKIKDEFYSREKQLQKLFNESTLRDKPDTDCIKQLLVDCLEEWFGKMATLERAKPNSSNSILNDLENLLAKYRK